MKPHLIVKKLILNFPGSLEFKEFLFKHFDSNNSFYNRFENEIDDKNKKIDSANTVFKKLNFWSMDQDYGLYRDQPPV